MGTNNSECLEAVFSKTNNSCVSCFPLESGLKTLDAFKKEVGSGCWPKNAIYKAVCVKTGGIFFSACSSSHISVNLSQKVKPQHVRLPSLPTAGGPKAHDWYSRDRACL